GGPLRCAQRRVDLPVRPILDLAAAQQRVEEAERAWRRLQTDGAPRARVRTAECDWFGAKKSAALAAAAKAGLVDEAVRARTPAPVQVIAVADRAFVGWPGEVFVEFALEVMRDHPNATIVT